MSVFICQHTTSYDREGKPFLTGARAIRRKIKGFGRSTVRREAHVHVQYFELFDAAGEFWIAKRTGDGNCVSTAYMRLPA